MKKIVMLVVVVLVVPCISRAAAVDTKLAELTSTIEQMRSGDAERNKEVAKALALVEQVNVQFAEVKGQLETTEHLLKQLQTSTSRQLIDLNARLNVMENEMDLYGEQVTKAVREVSPKVADEYSIYAKALKKVQGAEYLSAVADFQSFREKFPKSQFSGRAQLWIAECYFSMRDYAKAIKEYQVFMDKNPNDPETPNALYKQGVGFKELGMSEEAKPFLDKVIKKYPSSPFAQKARDEMAMIDRKDAKPTAAPITSAPAASTDAYDSIPTAPGVKKTASEIHE